MNGCQECAECAECIECAEWAEHELGSRKPPVRIRRTTAL